MPDTISTSPADGTHIFDDFHSNAAVTTGLLGSLDWLRTVVGAGTATPSYVASQNGVMRITTDGTTARGLAVHLMEDKVTLGGGNGVFIRFRARLTTQLAGNNFRVGITNGVIVTDPTVGIWVNSDAGVLSFDLASTNGDISVAVGGVTTLTSGTTMVVDTWHDFELRLSGTNANGGPKQIDCFVDGEPAGSIKASLLGSAETMEFSIVHWDDAGVAQVFDIDYYEAYIPRV
jgi:hypothetical protein